MSVATLRDFLLAALELLPGTRRFHIHVLVSASHKHTNLYRYAHPRPKVYLNDIVVLLSEQAGTGDAEPRALVTAVELAVYHIPATSCGLVYVSKVDTTGQGAHPSPTATLVKALLTYYADPKTRPLHVDTLWIQLFARAQGQYLFPNSSEYEGKKPLSDVKLCAWWKRLFGEVASELVSRMGGSGDAKLKTGLYYVLPGFNELEALANLHISSNAKPATAKAATVGWVYGHQYSQTDIRLPCPPPKSGNNLGHCIPWFDDDPKSRFMDEIAHTTEGDMIKSPEPKEKRSRTASGTFGRTRSRSDLSTRLGENGHTEEDKDDGDETPREKDREEKHHSPEGELGKVTPDEFWERMSFRQECIAGAVTGFFTLGIASPQPSSSSSASTSTSLPPPLAPHAGEVAPRLVKRVITSLMGFDFSTRENALRATETLEGVIRGLCESAVSPSSSSSTFESDARKRAPLLFADGPGDRDPVADGRAKTPEPHTAAMLEVPRTPTPKRGRNALPDVSTISPNPFPEPVASLQTYTAHIHGSIALSNPPLPPKSTSHPGGSTSSSGANGSNGTAAPAVTVLAVRKKKRKLDS